MGAEERIMEWEAEGKHLYIRELTSTKDYRDVELIQLEAWGFEEIDVVPSGQLIAARAAGGVLLGAFDGDNMIGFVYGFPGWEHNRISIHSHMLAVKPESRSLKAGAQLKLAQRLRTLQSGVNEITWTFDPLQSLNANLNFARLGVVSDRYIVNFYGEETSSHLHRGVGTDRLWVRWPIASERVKRRIEHGGRKEDAGAQVTAGDLEEPGPSVFALTSKGWERVTDLSDHLNSSGCPSEFLIEIPGSIARLKEENLELAGQWRSVLQNAFLTAFENGFAAVEVIRLGPDSAPRWFYQLKKTTLENYIQ